jgi:hypothetical protein
MTVPKPIYRATAEEARKYERAVLAEAEQQIRWWSEQFPNATRVGAVKLEGSYPETQLVFVMADAQSARWAGGELISFSIWRDRVLWELSRPFEPGCTPATNRLVGTMLEAIQEGGGGSP